MAIKRNKKDYGWHAKCQPVFLRIIDPKTKKNKILGWFPSKAAAKRKVYSFLDKNNCQYFDSSNHGEAWEMKMARDVKNSKFPFGTKYYDRVYHNAHQLASFLDEYGLVQ
tara:strand:+ start:54 stop:383 length:330 start_codon:yes stop_codon:yes gene_type:complete